MHLCINKQRYRKEGTILHGQSSLIHQKREQETSKRVVRQHHKITTQLRL